jgi:hypothetical protein
MSTLESFTFRINYKNEEKKITVKPHPEPLKNGNPTSFEIAVNGFPRGNIKNEANSWISSGILDQDFADAIGGQILKHYS